VTTPIAFADRLAGLRAAAGTPSYERVAAWTKTLAHFKSWRILHTDCRRFCDTYRDSYDVARALFFFSITWGFE
jgi:hypothetical protein